MTATTIPTAVPAAARALAVADRLFAADGISAVPLERVAAAAVVSIQTVRATYPDTHRLAIAALDYRQHAWLEGLRAATDAVADPHDAVLTVFTYLEATVDADGGDMGWLRNGYGELAADPDANQAADEHRARLEAHILRLCHIAGLPAHVADGISLLLHGAQVEMQIRGDRTPVRAARLSAATLLAVYETRTSWF